MTQGDRTELDANDPVIPVNNWLHLLFSNVYALDPFDQLSFQLWHKDTATQVDAVTLVHGNAANAGFVARREFIVQSHVVDLMGRLHVELFMTIT